MKHVKRHSIIVLAVSAIIIVTLVFLKIFFTYSYSENTLKESIRTFFMDNFNKAITLDDIYISSAGNIIIKNLNVSIGSDFNDNISLIACSEASVDMRFMGMLRGNPVVAGLDFENALVTVVKNYGKPYAETFESIFLTLNDIETMKNIDLASFDVSLDGAILYREVLRDDRFELSIRKVDLDIKFRSSKITYNFSGVLLPLESVELGEGSIDLSGKIQLGSGFKYEGSRHRVSMNNLDISYGNIFIREYDISAVKAGGGISIGGTMRQEDEKISIDTDVECNNLKLYYHGDPSRPFAVVSNENCNVSMKLSSNIDGNSIQVTDFSIYDDRIRINGSCGYENTLKKHYIWMEARSNKIDLEEVSRYIVPYQNLTYNGNLVLDCNIGYNIREKHADRFDLDVSLDKAGASIFKEGSHVTIFKDGRLRIKGHPQSLVMKLSAKRNRSDLSCEVYSDIATWYPFSANSVISVKSPVMEVENIGMVIRAGITRLYQRALIDAKEGYDETYFMQTPSGSFMVNNDISLNLMSQKVLVGKGAVLENCKVSIKSDKGRVTLQDFVMNGYNGQYDFNCEGYFNRDYPFLTMAGSVYNFDIGKFSSDAGIGKSTGTFSLAFDFEVNAYRLYQLLNNGHGTLNVSISDGTIEGTGIQKRLQNFFNVPGYDASAISLINYSSGNMFISHHGRNWYVRNLEFNGDTLRFSGRGKYQLEEELDVPLYATVEMQQQKDENETGTKTIKKGVPLVITGPLADPVLQVRDGEKKRLSLFNVN